MQRQLLVVLCVSVALWTGPVAARSAVVLPPATPEQFREADPDSSAIPATPESWWSIFADPTLDRLIAAANGRNATLEQSLARVEQVRARSRAADTARLPQVQGSGAMSRQTGPLINAAGGDGTLYNVGAGLSYELDLFGRLSKGSRAARRDVVASEAQLAAARLMMQGEVAQTYFRIRSLDDEESLLRRAFESYVETVRLFESNRAAGLVSAMQVELVRAEAADWQGEWLEVQRNRAELEHALAVLVGETASSFELVDAAASFIIPAIPAGLPSTMLLRRPDVRAAEAALEAAKLRVGMAKASWFPLISLTGSSGFASPTLGDLFRSAAQSGGVGLLFSLPLFDGGRQRARVRGAEADMHLAAGAYRETVLQSFREVEDQLVALRTLHEQAAQVDVAAAAASKGAAQAEQLHRAGLISGLDQLEAERRAIRTQRLMLRTRSDRIVATIGLIRALGGGWGALPDGRLVDRR